MARGETAARSRSGNGNNQDPAKELDAEIAALREDVAAITATLADLAKHRGQEAKAEIKKVRNSAIAKGEEAVDMVSENVQAAENEFKTMIRDKPIQSVLIAAGAGYILSKILRV
ncbi:DUF883 family protein [Pelagibacterium lentulum]|uniref:DUF883 domain-containing protein n=1 Tax=Pelagibacterium lentulum TaxID=2029865 RepID=A0A916R9L7_9HYPH|nr:DUF883 family protein [Pelagibacterium lentulum]GGA46404.1 hypothetical protein GCM10011499_15200 [Pelagibacterium lentulum]